MLPQQPCSRSGAWHAVDPAGHEDAMGARHNHSIGQECTRYLPGDVFEIDSILFGRREHG